MRSVLALYSTSMQELACNANFTSPQSGLSWQADGGDYFVLAAAYQAVPAGILRVNFSPGDMPANDTRAGAAALSPDALFASVQPAHSATLSADDPALSCVPFYGYSLWFIVDVAVAADMAAATTGSGFDTVLGVLRDDGSGGLTEVACNDQEAPGVMTSKVEWQAVPGPVLPGDWSLPGLCWHCPAYTRRAEVTSPR